jgi:ribosomal protein L11
MTATTRLLLEAAHGTSDPAVLTAAANGRSGSVTPVDIRRIAEMKIPDYSQKSGEPVSLDRAATIVWPLAQEMGISVADRP